MRGLAPVGARARRSKPRRRRPSSDGEPRVRPRSPSAGPRRCGPTARSCPTTSWARSSTRGPRSSTTPSPRSWASRTSSQALAALQEARRSREKALKEATDARGRLLERLRDGRRPAGAAGRGGPRGQGVGPRRGRRRCSAAPPPRGRERPRSTCCAGSRASSRPTRRGSRPPSRRCARRRRPCAPPAETAAARSRDAAALLESALAVPRGPRRRRLPGVRRARARSTAPGARSSATAVARLREAAREADAVHERAEAARRAVGGPGDAEGRRASRARPRWGWTSARSSRRSGPGSRRGRSPTSAALADHVEAASGPLREAVVRLRDSARAELGRKEDAWRPGWPSRSPPGCRRARERRARSRRPEAPQGRGGLAQEGGGRDPRRPLRPHRREGGRRSGSTCASRATSSWAGSSSRARARGAAWRSTSPSTASRARPSG